MPTTAIGGRLGAGLLLAGLAGAILGVGRPMPHLGVPPQVRLGDDYQWWFRVRIVNPLPSGLYTDSMSCDVEDLDPGETRTDRTQRLDLGGVVRIVPSVSGRDSGSFTFSAAGTAEHARLTFRLYAHDSRGKPLVATGVTESVPSDAAATLSSRFFESGGRRIEYVVVPAVRGRPSPAILLVHGHGSHARLLIGRALLLSEKHYCVMLVSQPGYGQSQGPADLMGPATVRALEQALDLLKRTAGVDSTRVAAWGVSRGATAVALLAERRPELRAVIAQSGIYDLWATYRGTKVPGFPETIVREAGKDSAAWRERSPIVACDRIRSAVLVLHGGEDANVPVGQAREFAAALERRGLPVETRFFRGQAHALPLAEVDKIALDFLERRLAPPAAADAH